MIPEKLMLLIFLFYFPILARSPIMNEQMKFLTSLLLITSLFVNSSSVFAQTGTTISLNPLVTYQTISGWEASSQSCELDCSLDATGKYNASYFNAYKNTLFDDAVNNLGINRVRLEVNSGGENPTEWFAQYLYGIGYYSPLPPGQPTIDYATWRTKRYEIINDNNDPNTIDPNGFYFDVLDIHIDNVILPLKQRIEVNGEKLYINLIYVDFGASTFEHKNNLAEYAEFMLAVFQHMQTKYGFVPDAVEMILEPDIGSVSWSATQIGNAIVAAGNRLAANGFHPEFIAPSTTSMANAPTFFDTIIGIAGVSQYLKEISYHRYGGVSDANLQAIASRGQQNGMRTSMLEHIGSGYQDLHKDLTMGRNSAWQQFTLAYSGADDGGAYYKIDTTNPANPLVNMGSRTKFLRQYFKFIRSGAVRIEATSSNLSSFEPVAFINADGKYVVVVKANIGNSFTVQNLPAGTYGIKYTTSSQYNIDNPDQTITAGQSLTTNIPAIGVITIYGKIVSATTPTPSPTPIHCLPLGNINCTGTVNVSDLSYLISKFGGNDSSVDLDDSGKVNVIDLSILLANFGR